MAHKYEIHVTMLGGEERNRRLVERRGWKFSKIDGDPILGDGVKHYATTHVESECEQFALDLSSAMRSTLEDEGVKVLRDKVEKIIHDNKTP